MEYRVKIFFLLPYFIKHKAYRICNSAAEQGDGQAQVQMGLNHLYGTNGAEKDAHKAFEWFSQTAPDDPVGLYWLAVCHNAGSGTEKNTARAFELFRESADMGYAPALCDLGVFYENGIETEKSMDTAVELYGAYTTLAVPVFSLKYADLISSYRTGKLTGSSSVTEA